MPSTDPPPGRAPDTAPIAVLAAQASRPTPRGDLQPEVDSDPRAGYLARVTVRYLSGIIGVVVLLAGLAVVRDGLVGAYQSTGITKPFAQRFGEPGIFGFAALGVVAGLATLAGVALRRRLLTRAGLASASAWFVIDSGVVVYGTLVSHTVVFPAVAWCGWGLAVAGLAGLGYLRGER